MKNKARFGEPGHGEAAGEESVGDDVSEFAWEVFDGEDSGVLAEEPVDGGLRRFEEGERDERSRGVGDERGAHGADAHPLDVDGGTDVGDGAGLVAVIAEAVERGGIGEDDAVVGAEDDHGGEVVAVDVPGGVGECVEVDDVAGGFVGPVGAGFAGDGVSEDEPDEEHDGTGDEADGRGDDAEGGAGFEPDDDEAAEPGDGGDEDGDDEGEDEGAAEEAEEARAAVGVELGVSGEVLVGGGSGGDVEHAVHDTARRRVGFSRAER